MATTDTTAPQAPAQRGGYRYYVLAVLVLGALALVKYLRGVR